MSVSASPSNAHVIAGKTQQFTAVVTNTSNKAVKWSATVGTVSSSGLFTARMVGSATQASVTATSQADSSKSATITLAVNPTTTTTATAAVLAVNPANLSFAGQVGSSQLTPASVSITNAGNGTLLFSGVTDQSWLGLSAFFGTAPSTLQVIPSITGLKTGTYTGHVTLTGGGLAQTVTVALNVTPAPVQRSVLLSWKASTNSAVASYSMYRSTVPGGSYGLMASALGTTSYSDQSVQSGATYYYVVTAVNDMGHESSYSNETRVVIP